VGATLPQVAILAMVYNTHNYRFSELCLSFSILKTRKSAFGEVADAICFLGTQQIVFIPSPEDGNTPSFRNVLFSSYVEFQTMDEVHEPSD
jgi:hypothetical protein